MLVPISAPEECKLSLGHAALNHNSLSATIQPVPYPASDPCVKYTTVQLRDKDVLWDSVKCFAGVQVDDICCSSLINQALNPSQKVATFVGHSLPSVKSCKLSPYTPPIFLIFHPQPCSHFISSLKDTIFVLYLQSTWRRRTDHPEHSCKVFQQYEY